ncbi:hypothetical protein [Qipengyuania oceanensis]|uniref:Uncharacterized protein n=1 Tax=Qipengyuania oceanensis TaxID=1463597 RepID=A0A844YCF3_9SPHN|nr:hypothetical protein [Qipengyuania oceanensis]MXO61871.1 hypothetical protein [Qipengyuania oceanensis]
MELSAISAFLLKFGAVLLILNEIRGFVMAAPIVWSLYQHGGSAMTWFITMCMLAGIAFSVIVPLMLAAWAKEKLARRAALAN